jgi:predicted nucleic acid-binding protein
MPSTGIAILDAGALYAALDRSDRQHEVCASLLRAGERRLVLPSMVLAEVCYLVETRLGPAVEARFLQSVEAFDLECPTPTDLRRMAELVRQYAEFPLGGTDASIVALAERIKIDTILTLDRRHFASVKPAHCESFRILPEG